MKRIIAVIIILFIIYKFINAIYYREFFEQKATSSEVGSGSSEYWGWGFDGIKEKHHKKERKCPKCDHVYIDNDVCNIIIDDRHKCRNCDITKNKDIDKYVLKSSVPPCPDLSNYATKSMVNACPDMNNYLLKSKLPEYCAAYRPDMDKYMLKSECMPIDQEQTCRGDIRKHPDFHKYISRDNCKKYKHSWIQDLDEWWESIFGGGNSHGQKRPTPSRFPTGYSYSPYAGYGTDNPGYGLDGQ